MAEISVMRMSGPGSDKIKTETLRGYQKQGMFCQALSRLLSEYIGPVVRPLPKSITVELITDEEGYHAVVLVPHHDKPEEHVPTKTVYPVGSEKRRK